MGCLGPDLLGQNGRDDYTKPHEDQIHTNDDQICMNTCTFANPCNASQHQFIIIFHTLSKSKTVNQTATCRQSSVS